MKLGYFILLCPCLLLACENDGSTTLNSAPDLALADAGQGSFQDVSMPADSSVSSMLDADVNDTEFDANLNDTETPAALADAGFILDQSLIEADVAVMVPIDLGASEQDQSVMMDASLSQGDRRSMGQCGFDGDCPNGVNGQICSRALPGGACLGCGTDSDCPSDATCNFGTCVTTCSEDADCAPGLSCTSRNRCGAARCVDGLCPDPRFDCGDSDRCTRRVCNTSDACGEGMDCRDGLCIEDSWL